MLLTVEPSEAGAVAVCHDELFREINGLAMPLAILWRHRIAFAHSISTARVTLASVAPSPVQGRQR